MKTINLEAKHSGIANIFGIDDALMLAGPGMQLVSSLMNADAQKKQLRNTQNDRAQQLEQQRQAMEMARQLQQQGIATNVDSHGNVTYYDKASNTWKTVLSPGSQQQQDIADREQVQQGQMATDAFAQEIANANRQQTEGQQANTAQSQLADVLAGRSTKTPQTFAANGRLAANDAADNAVDPVQSNLMAQSLRSGSGDINSIVSALAQARVGAARASTYNPNDAYAESQAYNGKQAGDFASLYGDLAGRATAMPGYSTSAGPGGALSANQMSMREGAGTDTANATTGIARASQIGQAADTMNPLNNVDARLVQQFGNAISTNKGSIEGFLGKLFGSAGGGGSSVANIGQGLTAMFGG